MGGSIYRFFRTKKKKTNIEKPEGLIFACSKVTPPPPKKALKEWHGILICCKLNVS